MPNCNVSNQSLTFQYNYKIGFLSKIYAVWPPTLSNFWQVTHRPQNKTGLFTEYHINIIAVGSKFQTALCTPQRRRSQITHFICHLNDNIQRKSYLCITEYLAIYFFIKLEHAMHMIKRLIIFQFILQMIASDKILDNIYWLSLCQSHSFLPYF